MSKQTTKQASPKTSAPVRTLGAMKKAEVQAMLDDLSKKDRKLKSVISKVDGGFALKIQDTDSPFEAIAEAIVYQQLTGKAAGTIFNRFKELFGKTGKCPSAAQIAKAPDTVLRSAGLSGSKVNALKDLAAKSLAGHIPTMKEIEKMSDDDIIKTLVAVKGVGTWTAHMFLMFRLGRLDVMPSGDYGVRKGFAITYGDAEELPSPAEIEEHAECWRPHRSVGSWYMWRAVELHRSLIPEKKTVVKKYVPAKPATKKAGSNKTTVSAKQATPAKKTAAAKKPTATKQILTKPPAKKQPLSKKRR